jgi:hypothetical protein
MENNDLRARVFISCGQSKQSDEVETARNIAKRLQDLGFDPYVAVEEQTLRGLKENIFGQLSRSEYFVFVDFKRERLATSTSTLHRGSLFSHQELALASYLDIPLIAFQEVGVKTDDGILRFLQANATPFTDRHLLPNVIADEVQRRSWSANWRNELILERDDNQHVDAMLGSTQHLGRFFHINVRNANRHQTATNCYVYLEKVTKLDPATAIPVQAVEFKWAGYKFPNVHIPPLSARRCDALWIRHGQPTQVQFNTYTDSTEFVPRVQGTGKYELHYAVVADNFPTARLRVVLELDALLDHTTLKTGRDTRAT